MIDRKKEITKTIKVKDNRFLVVYKFKEFPTVQLVDYMGFVIEEFIPTITPDPHKQVEEFIKKYQLAEGRSK